MKNYFKSFLWLPALIGLIVYIPSLSLGSSWGDDIYVINPFAKEPELVLKNFYHNTPGLHFVPLCLLQSFLINTMFGKNAFPFGFHLVQLFLHVICCCFITIILFRLTKNYLSSILMTILWVLHPINVETVTRIGCGPAQVSAALFCLIYLLCTLKLSDVNSRMKKVFLLIVSVISFLISITSYEQYFLVPWFVCLIYLFQVLNKNITLKKYLLIYLFPTMFVYLFYLLWKYVACNGALLETSNELIKWTEMGTIKDVLFRTFWLAPQLVVHYFRLFLWPDYLAESKADWYVVGRTLWSPYSLFCQFFVLSLIISAALAIKKNPLYSLGIFWFFSTMILVVQIIPLFNIIDEHYCYLSVLGIFLSIFSLFKSLNNRKIVFSLFIPISLFLLWRTELYIPSGKDTLTRNIYMAMEAPDWNKQAWIAKSIDLATVENRRQELPVWINEESFGRAVNTWTNKYLTIVPDYSYQYGPYQMPYNFKVFHGMFKSLFLLGQTEKLNIAVGTALKINHSWLGWHELSIFSKSIRQWEAAWEALKHAIRENPRMKHSYNEDFIKIAINADKIDEAKVFIAHYIDLFPESAFPYLFAGSFYSKIGEEEEALNHFREGIEPYKYPCINDGGLYRTAFDFFKEKKLVKDMVKTLNIVLSFDPENQLAKDELLKVEKTQNKK